MSTATRRWFDAIPRPGAIVGIAFLLVSWQLLSTQFPAYRFPGLQHLAGAFWQVVTNGTRYDVVENLGYTVIRIVLGFGIVMTFGTLAGVYMGLSKSTEDYLSPVVTTLLTVPSVIWAFLAVIWLGLSEFVAPVFVITIIIIPYVAIQMWQGTNDVPQDLLAMATAFGASREQVWRDVLIPYLTPYTLATSRLAFTLCWKLSLVAEIFGANTGVGVVVRNNFLSFQTDMIIAWALPVMLFTFLIERVLQRLEQRAYRWRDTDTTETSTQVLE